MTPTSAFLVSTPAVALRSMRFTEHRQLPVHNRGDDEMPRLPGDPMEHGSVSCSCLAEGLMEGIKAALDDIKDPAVVQYFQQLLDLIANAPSQELFALERLMGQQCQSDKFGGWKLNANDKVPDSIAELMQQLESRVVSTVLN
jgi:hypothetical protein